MTIEQFIYWLQGYVEISGEVPNKKQWQEIKNHLALVLDKKTPYQHTTTTTGTDTIKEWNVFTPDSTNPKRNDGITFVC